MLENLQWADSASLEMLHFVARQIAGDRILLVGTHNDPDHRGERAAARDRAVAAQFRKRSTPPSRAAAGRRAITELLERTFGADADANADEFAERLHRWTGGNPFFIDETIKALVERGQLRDGRAAGSAGTSKSCDVPATIRDAVLARLAELSPRRARLADIAAVLGHARHARRARRGERTRSRTL